MESIESLFEEEIEEIEEIEDDIEFSFEPRLDRKRCASCLNHRPNSRLIGSCALQSINNLNGAKRCVDYRLNVDL